MLKVASCMYCLNKDISIAFGAVLISLRCARYCEVTFLKNDSVGPALGVRYFFRYLGVTLLGLSMESCRSKQKCPPLGGFTLFKSPTLDTKLCWR